MKNSLFLFVFFLLLPGFFSSCKRNRFDIDVSQIEAEISIQRMEREFRALNSDSTDELHLSLNQEYGTFYRRYLENITGIGLVKDPAISYSIKAFLSDKYIAETFDDTEKKFSDDLGDIQAGLSEAFKHATFYFPEMIIPKVVSFVSGFQYSIAVTDSVLGIGLDMYLGKDYINYQKAGMPLFKISGMTRENIVPDAMKSWMMSEFFSDENKVPKDMLGTMVQHGKILFLMDALFPSGEDSMKIGYSPGQLEWCRENEFQIWAHLVDNELLFITEPQVITKFFNEAPFTSGLPKESPPKVGAWVGWQIVRRFMENNPEYSIPDLMKLGNAQEILKKSKYKPKK